MTQITFLEFTSLRSIQIRGEVTISVSAAAVVVVAVVVFPTTAAAAATTTTTAAAAAATIAASAAARVPVATPSCNHGRRWWD
jgi:uncharacterized protein (UPF0333 family)